VTVYLVGAEPPDELVRCAGPRVVVTGEVPDVRPYVARAAAFVVPLRMGGGTRLKVLEALSMEKPLVSTTIGCEGIDVRHGEHLLIADEAARFADSVLELLDSPERGAELARAGRALVERRYQWRAVVESIEAFATNLVGQKKREVPR
jgi:glycosyltransferase involved in cell wall biosynthesis